MMSTAVRVDEQKRTPAQLGTALDLSISDVAARRHLMPTVMDDPISTERQCVCPGGDVENSCIDTWTDYADRLCVACRENCWLIDEDGIAHLFVDVFGTTLPDIPSEVVWASNAKGTRAHAFVKECRGCHTSLADHLADWTPGSMCRQAWGRRGDQIVEGSTLQRCGTCARLVAARERGQ